MNRNLIAIVIVLLIAAGGAYAGLRWLGSMSVGGGGSEQTAPDVVKSGDPIIIGLILSTWGAGGPIENRYTDIELNYAHAGRNVFDSVKPKKVALPEQYRNATTTDKQWEAYEFTIPPLPKGTDASIEYNIKLTFDGVPSRLPGIKTVKVVPGIAAEAVATPFEKDLEAALTDPKWQAFATAFKETCNITEIELYLVIPKGAPFRKWIDSLEPSKIFAGGGKAVIVPCMIHAYQSSEMLAYFDGTKYMPVVESEPVVLDNGTIYNDYTVIGLTYDSAADIFTSFTKGRGIGDCWTKSEYKLVGKKLVLQKYTEKKDCDGEIGTGTTTFDIKQQTSTTTATSTASTSEAGD